jgi:hypothetical protein
MGTFTIQIDATSLFYRYFILHAVTPTWVDSRVVQTFDLEAKVYNFQFASGSLADFTFRVTPTGTIDYDAEYDGFLQGRGTNRLVLRGLSVTLDARYLGIGNGAGVLLCEVPMTNADWILHQTVRLLPGSYYRVQQGSGLGSSFSFKLRADGNFEYESTYDVAAKGFLAGNRTSTLIFRGYPFLIDATAINGIGVDLIDIWGLEFARNGVQFANLLPMTPYRLQVESGQLADATFVVNLDGTTTLDQGARFKLTRDKFHGVPRIRVTD